MRGDQEAVDDQQEAFRGHGSRDTIAWHDARAGGEAERGGHSGWDELRTGQIVSSDGQTVKLVVVRPVGVPGPLPAFMFFHGGGWVLGDYATHERLVRDLVAGSSATAVFVEYDRSPEAH